MDIYSLKYIPRTPKRKCGLGQTVNTRHTCTQLSRYCYKSKTHVNDIQTTIVRNKFRLNNTQSLADKSY